MGIKKTTKPLDTRKYTERPTEEANHSERDGNQDRPGVWSDQRSLTSFDEKSVAVEELATLAQLHSRANDANQINWIASQVQRLTLSNPSTQPRSTQPNPPPKSLNDDGRPSPAQWARLMKIYQGFVALMYALNEQHIKMQEQKKCKGCDESGILSNGTDKGSNSLPSYAMETFPIQIRDGNYDVPYPFPNALLKKGDDEALPDSNKSKGMKVSLSFDERMDQYQKMIDEMSRRLQRIQEQTK